MRIVWQNWLIESYARGYGYVVKRRITGSDRWKAEGYYADIKQASAALLCERIESETVEHTVDVTNASLARLGMSKLIARIDDVTAEILEGLDASRRD